MELNDDMKTLLRELGMALHRALTKDDEIKAITERIKGSGFDIYLFMEANIALDRREDEAEGQLYLHSPEEQAEMEDMWQFNNYDEQFLASLKIQANDTGK